MTVNVLNELRAQYIGDGTQNAFPVPFPFLAEQDVKAALTSPSGAVTALRFGTDYSVRSLAGGGELRATVPDGYRLTLYLEQEPSQTIDLRNTGMLDAPALERGLDKLTLLVAETRASLKRCVQVDVTDVLGPAELMREFREAVSLAVEKSGAAAEAAEIAREWADAAAGNFAGGPTASPLQKGLVPSGGEAGQVYRVNGDGQSYGFEYLSTVGPVVWNDVSDFALGQLCVSNGEIKQAVHPSGPGTANGPRYPYDKAYWRRFSDLPLGKIELFPFRFEELAEHAPGWHFCNGDLYPLAGSVGAALNALPESFKADWGIVVSGGNISIPNLFHSDGRGYFLRAADGTARKAGSAEGDAMRNITGSITDGWQYGYVAGSGAFYVGGSSGKGVNQFNQGSAYDTLYFNASRQVPTAAENRPLNIGMTPAIFLGV